MSIYQPILSYPLWAPLSGLCRSAVELVEGLHSLGSGWYAVTNCGFGGTKQDPGVGGLMWARSEAVALRVTGHVEVEPQTQTIEEFEGSMLDVQKSFGEIVRAEKMAGRRPQHNATFDFHSGAFRASELQVTQKTIFFDDLNPAKGDEPIAVLIHLATK